MHLLHHLLLLLVVTSSINGSSPEDPVHYDLIRHDHHITDVAKSDILRQVAIGHRLGRSRRMAWEVASRNATSTSAFAMPMNSGAYVGVGQYFVRFLVGTPAQKFVLAVDTGSELTWLECKFNGSGRGKGRLFDPERSRTFRPIGCASEMCKALPFALTECPAPTSSCLYDYLYQQNSVQGSFARESATIILSDGCHKTRAKLPGIVIGCTSSSAGTPFGNYDGVLGLAYTRRSFSTVATPRFGGKFSYCLVDHLSPRNASSYLIFGKRRGPESGNVRYAELNVAKPPLDPFYTINVFGISVGKQLLEIPPSVWLPETGGGVVLDSGSSLTTLVEPAYRAVTSALSASLAHVPSVDVEPFEFCYNWTNVRSVAMPRLVVHIAKHGEKGLVRFVPPVKSYLIDVADNVKCIGLLSTEWPASSTIGNILQQNHLWEYDIYHRRLGFKPSTCVRR